MNMSDKQIIRLSKWISLRLRHDPAGIGLAIDSVGWAAVDDLIAASARHEVRFDRATLQTVVDQNNKRRFEFDESGARIRARQGHPIDVELGYADTAPPDLLYHGTAAS